MKVFVINLARSPERRATIEKQLKLLDLDYEIFEAIDGATLSYSEIMKDTKALNYAVKSGEIGCALSHIGIYKKIISQNISEALIIEDDADISQETVNALDWLETLKIKKPCVTLLTEVSHYLSRKIHSEFRGNYALHEVLEANCSHGYVVNIEGAKRLVHFLYPVWMVADKWQALREYSVCEVLAISPQVINKTIHAEKSTIDASDNWVEQKKKFIWKEIKKRRPLKVKLKRFFWTSFVYPLLKVTK